MNPDVLRDALISAVGPMLALAVPAARLLGVFTILPLFTRLGITGLLRGGVSLALALPLVPALIGPLTPIAAAGGAPVVVILVKEVLVGVMIGMVAGVPFWAAEAAGEMLDQQRGSTSAILPDPSGGEAGVTGTLLVLVATVVFLSGGGLQLLQEGIQGTYAVWPAERLIPTFSADMPNRMLGILDSLTTGGLLLASPLLVAMLLAELALAMISRFAPQLNVFDLGMAVKGVVHAVGLPIYAFTLVGFIRDGFAPIKQLAAVMAGFAG